MYTRSPRTGRFASFILTGRRYCTVNNCILSLEFLLDRKSGSNPSSFFYHSSFWQWSYSRWRPCSAAFAALVLHPFGFGNGAAIEA